MGSRSTSRTSTTNSTENFTFNNVDNRVGKGGAGGSDGNANFNLANSSTGNIKIEKTDLGAIAKAFEFADNTLELANTSSAPSANTINVIGKNAALVAGVIGIVFIIGKKIA